MKKKSILATLVLGLFFIGFNHLNSNPTGAPAGYSGSPADGQTCGNCHGVTPTVATSGITTDIPQTGYIPGSTYTITINSTGNGRKGFQVSPQNNNGTLLGTLISGPSTQIVGSKYITHTAAINMNPAVWTFSWTAPAKGTGNVNFYGAFVKGYSNVSTQMVTVSEQTTTGVETQVSGNELFSYYPNPATGNVNLNLNLTESSKVTANLTNLEGKQIGTLFNNELLAGNNNVTLDLSSVKTGVYFLQVSVNGTTKNKKIVIY